MKRILAALLATLPLASLAAVPNQADLLIRHVTLVDVEHARLLPDQAVATSGDAITAVGKDGDIAKAWSAKQTVDGTKRYLIPGLWDMHVHFGGGPELADENKALLPVYIANGITTVRQAIDAGLSSIEHLDYAHKAGVKDEAAIAADFGAGRIDRAQANARLDADFDPATAMEAYRSMAAKGLVVTPTLNVSRIIAYLDRDNHSKDEDLAYIGPGLRKTYDWRIQRAALDRLLADTRAKVAAWNKEAN